MLTLFKRLLIFSGKQKKNVLWSFVFNLIDSIFQMIPIVAIITVFAGVLETIEGNKMNISTVWISMGIMLISVVGRIIFNNQACIKRTLSSFAMCSEKRLEIGEHMKRVPMGYFSENRLGDITAAVTTTLGDIENNAVSIFEKIAGGFIHAIVIGIWLFFYEWHIGIIMFVGLILSMGVYALIQHISQKLSPRRQKAQADLVSAVLEYIQGMGVVKAFGLGKKSGKTVDNAIEESALANIKLEFNFSTLIGMYQTVFKIARAAILVVAPYLLTNGEVTPVKCLLLLVSSFMIYSSVEIMGSMSSIARVIESSLDRLEAILNTPILDEKGKDLKPSNYDIDIEEISFAYGKNEVLTDVSFKIPQNTTCAIIGPSGSGKTTLVNLITRFWDVNKGAIKVGGINVKEYSCDSLLTNFSMVFQKVYLFDDTIENNIKFGNPKATHKQVIEAAKKACCHDFIMKFPKGYDTNVGESGASLSGGEKQRISIARAILKDAPIVILDEATASVDPENEIELQKAIAELTKNKTIVMIAHRLTTVKNADQIIVLDKGKIVQTGTHVELLNKEGIYRRFIRIREEAIGWKLNKSIN